MPDMDFSYNFFTNSLINFNDDIANITVDGSFINIKNLYIGKVVSNNIDTNKMYIGEIQVYIHELCDKETDTISVKPLYTPSFTLPNVGDYVLIFRTLFDTFYYIPNKLLISDETQINNIYDNMMLGKNVVDNNFNQIYYFGDTQFKRYVSVYSNNNIKEFQGIVIKTNKHQLLLDDINNILKYNFANNLFVVKPEKVHFTMNKVSVVTEESTLHIYGNVIVHGDFDFDDNTSTPPSLIELEPVSNTNNTTNIGNISNNIIDLFNNNTSNYTNITNNNIVNNVNNVSTIGNVSTTVSTTPTQTINQPKKTNKLKEMLNPVNPVFSSTNSLTFNSNTISTTQSSISTVSSTISTTSNNINVKSEQLLLEGNSITTISTNEIKRVDNINIDSNCMSINTNTLSVNTQIAYLTLGKYTITNETPKSETTQQQQYKLVYEKDLIEYNNKVKEILTDIVNSIQLDNSTKSNILNKIQQLDIMSNLNIFVKEVTE